MAKYELTLRELKVIYRGLEHEYIRDNELKVLLDKFWRWIQEDENDSKRSRTPKEDDTSHDRNLFDGDK